MIEKTIGVGGMGAVYLAVDQKFGSLVAIKETFYGDTELAEAFEREARLLNGLHHPVFPHVSDNFTENGGHFLVMEYIEGEDLSELIKRGEEFPVETVMGWTLDLIDGLDYLHSQEPSITHRDIKPNNLKLTSRGKIVLLDFGMAKETSSNTLAGRSVFGYSRRYSPLEQIEGSGTDARSDIFSLGATVYHLMTGTPPVDVLRRASAIVAGRPDPLLPASSVNPAVPSSVSEVLTVALALNAENRYASAKALGEALENAIKVGAEDDASERKMKTAAAGAMAVAAGSDFVPNTAAERNEPPRTVIDEKDVVIPEAPIADSAFNARSELRRRLRSMLPESVQTVRIRRPSRPSYAVWLTVLLLCLGLVGTYLGFKKGDNTPTAEPESSHVDSAPTDPSHATAEATNVAPESDSVVAAETLKEDTSNEIKDAVVARREPSRQISDKPSREAKTATDPVRTPERRTQDRRAPSQRPRRVVQPVFEQPRVSSIEAIMTGVPYEGRQRSVDSNVMTEDERRRRRLRRISPRYQPY